MHAFPLLLLSMPGDVLHLESCPPSEGSEPVRKKLQLDIDILPEDDAEKPWLDIGISGTCKYVNISISILNLYCSIKLKSFRLLLRTSLAYTCL